MKHLNFLFLISLFFILGCEDVIDIDLNNASPKLVIEASIQWENGTTGNEQKIKLTTTTGFYSSEVPVVSNAVVTISNQNDTFVFTENPGTGIYICTNFSPVIGETYLLTINYNGEIYSATEKLIGTPAIENIEQNNNGGFTGNDIEIKFLYQDNGIEENFYLTQFTPNFTILPEYDVNDDEFFQGNQMFGLYSNEEMKPNDILNFTLHGISEKYYNYLNILLGIAGNNGGSPFSTPSATVRGNIINQTNSDNYPLGYFSLSETQKATYIIQ